MTTEAQAIYQRRTGARNPALLDVCPPVSLSRLFYQRFKRSSKHPVC
jgi:hypothetical protein